MRLGRPPQDTQNAGTKAVKPNKSEIDDLWQRIDQSVADIAADRTRGSRELALDMAKAVAGFGECAEVVGSEPEDAGWGEKLALRVVRAQPEMASFYHLAAALLGCRGARQLWERADAFSSRLMAEPVMLELVEEGSTVATYSRSGSVLSALLAARRSGRSFRVWIGEARPGGEGLTVAAELAAAGVAVEAMTDAALFARVPQADLILLGADAVGRRSFLNKVGTRALLAAARIGEGRAYVLADATKLLPEELWPARRERSPDEVWADAPGGVSVRNPYFEALPLAEALGVVTGGEVHTSEAVEAMVNEAAIVLGPVAELMKRE